MKKNYKFLEKHKDELNSTIQSLRHEAWSLEFPVFIFNRCWFKLTKVRLNELSKQLRPDNSDELPELVRHKQLIQEGLDPLIALQECWHEFGMEDFHRSLRNSWEWQSKGNNGWTFKKYSELITTYRNNIDQSNICIPLIVLGRNTKENHILEWMNKDSLIQISI